MAAGTPATVTRPRGWLWWPHAMRAHGHEVGTRLHAAPCLAGVPAGPEEGDILRTSWGHPEDILGTSISFCCWLRCSRASPQAALTGIQRWRCHPPAPISPKCPQEKVPKGSPRCPYQVGRGGRALGVLLGRITRAGAEVGAGHAAPVEGAQDADGGLARAEDEELLPVTRVGGVVPQHLA